LLSPCSFHREKELQSHKEVLMRLYETAFLIVPNLAEDETEELIQKMAAIVTDNKGEMVEIDTWGKRKLAYQIQKFDAAFYVFFHYRSEADVPTELERRFKQTETILRYLTTRMEEETKPRRKKARHSQPKEAAGERMTAPNREDESPAAPEEAPEKKAEAPKETEPEPVEAQEESTPVSAEAPEEPASDEAAKEAEPAPAKADEEADKEEK
jgi:small subunit ribosomal protein S6